MKYFITLSLLLTSLFSWSQSSVVVTGEFMHMIEDDFDRGVSRDIYQLQEEKTSKMIELKFKEDKANKERPKELENISPSDKIRVTGKKDKDVLHVEKLEKLKKK